MCRSLVSSNARCARSLRTRAVGCDRELEGVRRILRDGNGADRQLEVYAATGDPREVARDIANVMQAG